MKTNFHTHTYRCGHAIGNEEEMVKGAIRNNVEVLGFSCHIPLPRYRGHLLKGARYVLHSWRAIAALTRAMILNGPAMRMPYRMKDTHIMKVKKVKEKYKDSITIFQGFEAEYFEAYLPYYQELLDSGEVEYLILGHHFDKYSVHSRYYGNPTITNKEIVQYKEDVIKAFDTELFSYLAHPDLFMIGKKTWDAFAEKITREICIKAKEKKVPLEINGGGIRRGLREVSGEQIYPYPNPHFWDIVSEIGNDVVIGIDAHHPEDFNDEIGIVLDDFIKAHNLHVIDTFPFKKGRNNKT